MSKSPRGVTEEVDVNTDSGGKLFEVGSGARDSVSRVMSDSSSPVSALSLPKPGSDEKREVCQHGVPRI